MKKELKCLFMVILLWMLQATMVAAGGIELLADNTAMSSQLPVYEECENIADFSLNNGKINGVSYEVTIPYPAEDVIQFYKESMKEKGYAELNSSNPKVWERYVDDTKEGSPYITQYIEDWVDKNKEKRVRLVLKYSTTSSPGGKTNFSDWISLKVRIQSMPF